MSVTEYLRNACLGWQDYLKSEKLIVFFFLVLLIFWLRNKWDDYRVLFDYSAVVAFVCIFPPTAVGLMLYQTKYYDYQWILALIPINTVIALGGTVLLSQLREFKKIKNSRKWFVVFVLFSILVLSGSKSETDWQVKDGKERKAQVQAVLQEISGDQRVLWAPDDILEYSRELRPDINLLYGRDMFQKDLGGFSFDVYDAKTVACYDWMVLAQTYYEQSRFPIDDIYWFDWIVEKGVNVVILPESLRESTRHRIERHYHTESRKVGDYYLLTL